MPAPTWAEMALLQVMVSSWSIRAADPDLIITCTPLRYCMSHELLEHQEIFQANFVSPSGRLRSGDAHMVRRLSVRSSPEPEFFLPSLHQLGTKIRLSHCSLDSLRQSRVHSFSPAPWCWTRKQSQAVVVSSRHRFSTQVKPPSIKCANRH